MFLLLNLLVMFMNCNFSELLRVCMNRLMKVYPVFAGKILFFNQFCCIIMSSTNHFALYLSIDELFMASGTNLCVSPLKFLYISLLCL